MVVYFVKLINSSDFMKTNDEMKSWGRLTIRNGMNIGRIFDSKNKAFEVISL